MKKEKFTVLVKKENAKENAKESLLQELVKDYGTLENALKKVIEFYRDRRKK